jgi:hypothetical protein
MQIQIPTNQKYQYHCGDAIPIVEIKILGWLQTAPKNAQRRKRPKYTPK